MPTNFLQSFVGRVPDCSSGEAADALLAELARHYGFDFYAVVRQPKPHESPMKLVLSGRFPKGWPEFYIKKKYVLIDPTIRYLARAQQSFRWREAAAAFADDPQFRRMRQMMTEAQKFGLHDGYVFPVHGRRGLLGNMTLGGPEIDVPPVEMVVLEAVAKSLFWKLLDLRQPEYSTHFASEIRAQLTHREMEALNYLADGMTSPEIANILKISNHTVDWYMNGIQRKLEAKNRHHAVAIAFRLGLVF